MCICNVRGTDCVILVNLGWGTLTEITLRIFCLRSTRDMGAIWGMLFLVGIIRVVGRLSYCGIQQLILEIRAVHDLEWELETSPETEKKTSFLFGATCQIYVI